MAANVDGGGLSWRERVGFGAGDFAQNLLYPAVGMYLLFFYTDIFRIDPKSAATLFLVAQVVDVLWNPMVGAFVDRHSPKWGKYRTYLLAAGIPLAVLSVLCFFDPFGDSGSMAKLVYAYATFMGFAMLFTVVGVAYGALGSSLSRDTDEITVLTTVRILMANTGCLVAAAGIPLLVALAAGREDLPHGMAIFMGLGMLPSFFFMPLIPAIRRRLGKKRIFFAFAPIAGFGMAALYAVSRAGLVESNPVLAHIAQFVKASGIVLATGCMWAFVPDVVSYAERVGGKRMSGMITAIMGVFFRLGMAFGRILSGAVLAWTGYNAVADDKSESLPADPHAWLVAMCAFAALAVMLFVISFAWTKERVVMPPSSSSDVSLRDMWRLLRNCRPLRTLAFFFFFAFAMMSAGNASGAYFMNGLSVQSPLAQEGVRWLVCVFPAAFLLVAAAFLSRYPLTDDVVDRLNREIEEGR